MRIAALVSGIAVILTLAPAASAQEVRFRGAFTLTSTQNCIARYRGETFDSAYRPAGVGDNPNVTSLTQLNEYSADVYELPAATFQVNRWTPVRGYGIDNLHYEFPARIKITGQAPRTITTRTAFVYLTGVIENVGNDPGLDGTCVATFRGSYFRRVE